MTSIFFLFFSSNSLIDFSLAPIATISLLKFSSNKFISYRGQCPQPNYQKIPRTNLGIFCTKHIAFNWLNKL